MSTQDSVSRRTFVKGSALAGLGAAALGSASLFGCSGNAEPKPEEVTPEEKIVYTHCAVNCGCCDVWKCHVVDGMITYVETDDTGSSEFGQRQLRACARGRSARRWLQHPDRLNYPLKRKAGTKRGDGEYEQISWDEALDTIASEMKRIRETYGNEAMSVHYSSGVCQGIYCNNPVNRLFNITGGHINFYGSYSSAQISQAGTFTYGGGTYGSSFLTLQDNELVVLFGNAVYESRGGGCGHGYDFATMREEKNLRVISIDPRHSDNTCGQGGEWIPIRPGTDGALCSALAYQWIVNDQVDHEFLDTYCVGFDDTTMPEAYKGKNMSFKDYIMGTGYDMIEKTPLWASKITGIPEQRIIDLAQEMAEADPIFIAQGYGINRRANGETHARAVMMLPQLLGQIGHPGQTDGRREGSVSLGIPGMPVGENPVTLAIPTYEWPNAIKDGTKLTALNAGVQGAEKMETSIKFIFNYAGNCLTNQHSDINLTHDILVDESLCEFIVTSEVFMTDSAKYSDIILPDLTSQEQITISNDGYADNMIAGIFGTPVYDAPFERRGIYEVCCDLAERLGVYEEYSDGGKTREDWARFCLDQAREANPNIPEWDEAFAIGVYKEDPQPFVKLDTFVADPEANPLPTPSGKIEIFSERLQGFAETWELGEGELITPIPQYDPAFNGVDQLSEEYPLLISGFASKAHVHSSYANNEIIESAIHDCAWINPVDAEPRGIKTGDEVRIFNNVGELRIIARVTPRVMPGTVCMPAARWHDADMNGDRVDHGGNINTINEYHPTALGKANPQHSNIGQVEKA